MYDVIAEEDNESEATAGCGPLLSTDTPDAKPLRQQVFEHVRAAGRAARTDMTRAIGISAGSATTLTADLISAGLLREVEGLPREAGRGRPPVALEVVPEARYVIGIKLSDETHSAVLTDFAGRIVAHATLPSAPGRKSLNALLEEIDVLMDLALKEAGKPLSDISAVGIGMPGIVDHDTGTVSWSPFLTVPDIDLRSAFLSRFGVPVHVDNDTNVLSLAELWFGAGRSISDFAVVTIENGVGMGLVLDNRLFRGARGMGLELGHTKVQLDGALCRCGQRGCLEAYLADYALAREAATALHRDPRMLQSPSEMLEALFAQAKSGNEAARTIFRRAGRYLSAGLSNVVQLFDPGLIILSGERMQYDFLYSEEVLAEMQKLTLSDGRTPCKVEIHAWGGMIWARGATALALEAVTDAALGEARA
ncbi:putative NBD/HSP70 family sugar kinase [Yoonia maricola]|uniref:Putative NBD/HSP70 family sugar kinase n=1 Tax=Yoonia maricola TaxID=420999 RepID=A0A2M8WKG5_9RHOB|nr:ROK family protein [Yoonia maricola]PJI91402.1 putative NBD/HSP70 family sugar kinase [Yoonia maricola]